VSTGRVEEAEDIAGEIAVPGKAGTLVIPPMETAAEKRLPWPLIKAIYRIIADSQAVGISLPEGPGQAAEPA
jgi:hypothetical protein